MVMSLIESLTRIKNAVYGREVREAIHDGVFRANQIVDKADAKADATQIRQDAVEDFNTQVIQEMTDKDVISAPEIIQMRTSLLGKQHPTSQQRINTIEKNIKYVTYEMFGANGDRKYFNDLDGKYYLEPNFATEYNHDDGLEIASAHEYANQESLPILNISGEYLIKETRHIPVMSNCDLGESVFHIDESVAGFNGELFVVKGKYESFNLDSSDFSAILSDLKKGSRSIPGLARYENHFALIKDNTKKFGKRQGGGLYSVGRDWQEFFYIGPGGKLVGDIAWDFDNITSVQLVKCDESYLTVKGGTFFVNGKLDAVGSTDGYKRSGIRVERSRVILESQLVGLENDTVDTSTAYQSGFFIFDKVYDVTIKSSKMSPRKALGTAGTYGIGGQNIVGLKISDLSADGSSMYWGLMGLNLVKNLTISNSAINRVDVHFFAWNVYIYNSTIGEGSIRLSGGGDLIVRDTSVDGSSFISTREDFGGYWDGDIVVENGTLNVTVPHTVDILVIAPSSESVEDYGHDLFLGRSISVRNFNINFQAGKNNFSDARCIRFGSVQKLGDRRVVLPSFVEFENIKVTGRDRGVRLFSIEKPHLYRCASKGSFSSPENYVGYIDINPNSTFKFKNVQVTEDVQTSEHNSAHIYMNTAAIETLEDEYSFVPEIQIEDCKPLRIVTVATANKLLINNSVVRSISAESSDVGRTQSIITNSELRPIVVFNGNQAYRVTRGDHRLVNSEFYPYYDGSTKDLAKTLTHGGYIQKPFDKFRLYGQFLGNKLSKDLYDYLAATYPSSHIALMEELSASTNYARAFFVERTA